MVVLTPMKERQVVVEVMMMMARVVVEVVDVIEGPGWREHLHGSDRIGTWPWSPSRPILECKNS